MKLKIVETAAEKEQAFQVRTIVFVNEQNVSPDIELDEHDKEAIHFIGYEGNKPVAASRLRFLNDYGKLERICVVKAFRGKAYGKKLIKQMEEAIIQNGYQLAKLNAQTHAIHFYEQLGYTIVSEEFIDAGIPHVTMIKQLTK